MFGGPVGARVGIGGIERGFVGSSMELGVTKGVSMVGVDVVGATGTAAAGAKVVMVTVGEVPGMAQVSVRPPSIHVALPRVNVVLVDTTSG